MQYLGLDCELESLELGLEFCTGELWIWRFPNDDIHVLYETTVKIGYESYDQQEKEFCVKQVGRAFMLRIPRVGEITCFGSFQKLTRQVPESW